MTDHLKVTAILLMAGNGSRFGSALAKQFHLLLGKQIYEHTLERFIQSHLFDEIILVCPAEKMQHIQCDVPSSVRLVAGGASRQESSFLGLLACDNSDIVCIHDAVRPFVTTAILKEHILKAKEYGAVNACIATTDTIVYAPNQTTIDAIPKRSDYYCGQTPQTFRYPLIRQAHEFAREKGITNSTDDCSLLLAINHPVHIVPGSEHNIKITTKLDLCIAEQILKLQHMHILSTSSSTLAGKRYIITGATGGIGNKLTEALQKENAIVIPLSRSSKEFCADLSIYASTQTIFQKIHSAFGPVDGLINCIGHLKKGSLAELSQEDIQQQLSTNLSALIFCCKCASLKPNAHIINIASSSYLRGKKDYSIYACAKAAVVNFTQGLAEERPDLFVNALVPQRTNTTMRLHNFGNEDPTYLLDPQEVAQEIIALLKQNTLKGSVIEVRKK